MLALVLNFVPVARGIVCAPGFTCYQENVDKVWVLKNNGNVFGPNCAEQCSTALCGTSHFYTCDGDQKISDSNFNAISAGLGFTCRQGNCWNSVSEPGMVWVSIDTATNKACYFPQDNTSTFDCSKTIANQNCFGERFSLICPCKPAALDTACHWSSDVYSSAIATWPIGSEGKSCLDRINYWRQRACAEHWIECPPCGLPPMVEGVACHACANSEADFDSVHGAHASFTRCGEFVQGEGGGATCSDVIDAFVAERAPDASGVVRCTGHCGPIVESGCRAFFYGKSVNNFFTLNWSPCDKAKADAYCNDPAQTAVGGVCRQDAPTSVPTPPPSVPTQPPNVPTPPPSVPTQPPNVPTQAPSVPTPPPSIPTAPPSVPSQPPSVPTQPPNVPTPPPNSPTRSPTQLPSQPSVPPSLVPTQPPSKRTKRPTRTRPSRRPHKTKRPTRRRRENPSQNDYDYEQI